MTTDLTPRALWQNVNETHVQYDGMFFNSTTLREFNYTIYSNRTLSNHTHCYLSFRPFTPSLLPNGTISLGTPCTVPILPIQARGILGLFFGILFIILIIVSTVCLRKHGTLYLPAQKRFHPVSRRWPWYWFILSASCGAISGFVSVDINRNYLQGPALMLSGFFYVAGGPAAAAAVWEMTRHWGSFRERVECDGNPWRFQEGDRRGKLEFWMPLVFYPFAFMIAAIEG